MICPIGGTLSGDAQAQFAGEHLYDLGKLETT
jgi:hypothetical protein